MAMSATARHKKVYDQLLNNGIRSPLIPFDHARLNQADQNLVDLFTKPVRRVCHLPDVRNIPRDGSAEYFLELIEALASGDNTLTGLSQGFVSFVNPLDRQ